MKKPSILSIKKSPKKLFAGENAIHKYVASDAVVNSDDVLMKLVRDAVLVLDNNFKIQHWNKGAEEMYGWKEEEVIRQNFLRGIPYQSQQRHSCYN